MVLVSLKLVSNDCIFLKMDAKSVCIGPRFGCSAVMVGRS